MNIIILGPQGSGKGTQAKLLVKKFNYKYFEAGDILREKAKEKSPFGQEINRIMNQKGALVPGPVMERIVDGWLNKIDVGEGIVFDGYPRNIEQYNVLKKLLAKRKTKIDKVIYLTVSQKVSLERLSGRRICPRCDFEYNLVTKPPKKNEFCDRCQVKLIQRRDDTPKMIKTRLETYYRETKPLINQFRQQGIIEEVPGERSISEIHQDILRRLEK